MVPRNILEEKLAAIWCEVLGLEKVGIHDNFFEIGGDSILSIQVVTLAAKKNIRLDVVEIFEYPTIDELSKYASLLVEN